MSQKVVMKRRTSSKLSLSNKWIQTHNQTQTEQQTFLLPKESITLALFSILFLLKLTRLIALTLSFRCFLVRLEIDHNRINVFIVKAFVCSDIKGVTISTLKHSLFLIVMIFITKLMFRLLCIIRLFLQLWRLLCY